MKLLLPTLLGLFLSLIADLSFCQQSNLTVRVTITVMNAATNKPVHEAEVNLRKVVFGPKVQTTDTYGKAFFEVIPTGKAIEVEVQGSFLSGLKKTTATIPLKGDEHNYELTVVMRSSDKIVNVFVTENETEKPVSDAHVVLTNVTDMRDGTANTDGGGQVSFNVELFSSSKTMSLTITKDGYKSYKSKVTIDGQSDNYTVNAALQKELGFKPLNVTVIDETDHPIVGAKVTADLSFLELTIGTTDENGSARLMLQGSGDYKVSVSQSEFETLEQDINIKKYGDQESYSLIFRLKRKPKKLRDLVVKVYDVSNREPVPNVQVEAGNAISMTGADGSAALKRVAVFGETVKIRVTSTGDKFEEGSTAYTAGGENVYRYFVPDQDEVAIGLIRKTAKTSLTIQVIDEKTDRPIGGASVTIKPLQGNSVATQSGSTNPKGEVTFKLQSKVNESITIRAMAKKGNEYEERWSDITPDFMQSVFDEKYYTIFLKKKTPPVEKNEQKYGPFSADLKGWASTGVHITKGGNFRTETTGDIITYVEPGTNKIVEMHPDGFGYWGWFVLAVRINKQIIHVGSKGGGIADEEGVIEVGVPQVNGFHPDDGPPKSGAFKIFIYSKDAMQTQSGIIPPEKLSNAKKDLGFLDLLGKGEKIPNLSPDQIADQVKTIISDNNLENVKKYYKPEDGINYIKVYHEYFYGRSGNPSVIEKQNYQDFINMMTTELKAKIGTMGF